MKQKPTSIDSYLRQDEQVLWTSKCLPFPLLGADNKRSAVTTWIATVVSAAALLGLYFKYNSMPSKGFVLCVLVLSAVIISSPFLQRFKLQGQQFCITNQRVALISRDHTVYYMNPEDVDDLQIIENPATPKSIVLGSVIFENIRKQLRWQACNPRLTTQAAYQDEHAEGLVLYCPERMEDALALLGQMRTPRDTLKRAS